VLRGPATAKASAAIAWHPLKLANGWRPASRAGLYTGTPAWAVRAGVVYLRGAIKRPAADDDNIVGELPKAAWPATGLYLSVDTSADVPGIVYVGTNGVLEAFDGNAPAFTSLSAISYPAVSMHTHKLALRNGWHSDQPVYATGDPSYAVSGGVVYLSGSVAGGTKPAFTVLPKAARPARRLYIQVYTLNGSRGWLLILPNGQVRASGLLAADYTSLAGVSFPVASTKWHPFALEGGWSSTAAAKGTAAPAYAVINGVVYLNGTMAQAYSGFGLWTNLPAAAQASHLLEIEVDTSGGTGGDLGITSSAGLIIGAPFTNAQAFTSLAGVAYPHSS
jgi:hypothetical protein